VSDLPEWALTGEPLVEGEDYYFDGGNMVFTAKYHLNRGYCCGSGCRHCPWKVEDAKTSV
jgi:hypothetical protein